MLGVSVVSLLVTASLEPLGEPTEVVRYAITQGGLLCVALLLLAWIRSLHLREVDSKEVLLSAKEEMREREVATERGRAEAAERSLHVVTGLVAQSNTTMQKAIDQMTWMQDSINRLTGSIERLDERRRSQG